MLAMMTPTLIKVLLYPLRTFLTALKLIFLAQAAQLSLLMQEVQLATHAEHVLVLVR